MKRFAARLLFATIFAMFVLALFTPVHAQNLKYSMPATHPAVRAGVELLVSWGAPPNVEYFDYVDNWGYPTHEVRFRKDAKLYNAIAGLLAVNPDGSAPQNLTVAFDEMKILGMIDSAKSIPAPAPAVTTPAVVAVDNVIGAPDTNRKGLYEPAAGTDPHAGDQYTSKDGRKWLALQVSFGFGGSAVNIRWLPN